MGEERPRQAWELGKRKGKRYLYYYVHLPGKTTTAFSGRI
jgi:hypothetical protein